MDREELVRLAGEQSLLKRDLRALQAEHQRDLQHLRNLPNNIDRASDWLDQGIALLRRIDERQKQIAEGHRRLGEYNKLTGID